MMCNMVMPVKMMICFLKRNLPGSWQRATGNWQWANTLHYGLYASERVGTVNSGGDRHLPQCGT